MTAYRSNRFSLASRSRALCLSFGVVGYLAVVSACSLWTTTALANQPPPPQPLPAQPLPSQSAPAAPTAPATPAAQPLPPAPPSAPPAPSEAGQPTPIPPPQPSEGAVAAPEPTLTAPAIGETPAEPVVPANAPPVAEPIAPASPQTLPTQAAAPVEPVGQSSSSKHRQSPLESAWVRKPDDGGKKDADLVAAGEQPLGRVRFTFSAGYFYGGLDHPLMAKSTAHGGMMEFDFGLLGTKQWSLGLALQGSAMPLRESNGKYVRKGLDTDEPVTEVRAGCENCEAQPGGGKIIIREALMTSLMPRVEYTPLGRTGPFIAVGGGVGTINMRGMRVGGAVDARTGFRYAAAQRLAFGASVGFHAVMANNARAWIPFAAAEIRMN